MRIDGRAWDQLRPVDMIAGYVEVAEGSVLIEMGKTRVLCNASVDESVPAWRMHSGLGWITAEYALLPRSTHQRSRRERGGPSGRTQEIQRLIGRSLRAAADLRALGERTIMLDCDVIQADGGTRTAAITAAYVALALAVRQLEQNERIQAPVLLTQVAATSVGLVDGQLLLDLCYTEDSAATCDVNIVMTGDNRLIEVQGTAESQPFSRSELDAMLDLASQGIEQLLTMQRQVLDQALGAAE